jgi:hypothetical protein
MHISLPFLLITMTLYGLCTAVAVGLILRLRDRARIERSSGAKFIVAVLGDIIGLAALPIAASIGVFFGPTLVSGFFSGDATSALGQVGAFATAQLIWSAPSACFYVLGTRLLRERFSLRKVVRYALLSLCALGLVALVSRSGVPQFAAGIVAQVVAGLLPMSALSALPAKISIGIDGGSTRFYEDSISLGRASCLCVVIALGYLLLKLSHIDSDDRA